MHKKPENKSVRAGAVGVIGLAVASLIYGFHGILAFQTTPAAQLPAPSEWPSGSSLPWKAGRLRLLVFAHPRCACTNATLNELSGVLARLKTAAPNQPAPEVSVIFVHPNPAEAASLSRRIDGIPGVHVITDETGIEAKRFGAKTSGEIFLYSAAGALLFHGGITGSRGHIGRNFAEDDLFAALVSGSRSTTPRMVFGCSLKQGENRSAN